MLFDMAKSVNLSFFINDTIIFVYNSPIFISMNEFTFKSRPISLRIFILFVM